jgi:NAD(P)-dependent dehydrogenase (short-subunit alcohol dehydrogenase family)
MPVILVVGATRGLGASLVKLYASDSNNDVYATSRTSQTPANSAFNSFPVALVRTDM